MYEISNSDAFKQARRCAFKQRLLVPTSIPGKPHLYQNRTSDRELPNTPITSFNPTSLLQSCPTKSRSNLSLIVDAKNLVSIPSRGKKNLRSLQHRIYLGINRCSHRGLERDSLQLPCVISA